MPSRDAVMKAVKDNVKGTYSKAEVMSLLNSLEHEHEAVEVEAIRRGDVFWHKVVGGKMRPWIALSVRSDLVVGIAMSTGDSAPRMVPAQCRFWGGRWVGTTTTLVKADDARMAVTRPYTNPEHLREIEAHLAELHGLRPIKGRRPAL